MTPRFWPERLKDRAALLGDGKAWNNRLGVSFWSSVMAMDVGVETLSGRWTHKPEVIEMAVA